jgi:hypothetical protein
LTRLALAALLVVAIAVAIWAAIAQAMRPVTISVSWPPDPSRAFPGVLENESGATIRRLQSRQSRAPLIAYIGAQLRNGTTAAAPPPDAITGILQHAAELREEIEREAPRWAVDVQDAIEPPQAPLSAAQYAVTLLVTDALAQLSHGDSPTASRDLEAAYRIARAVVRRPELIAHIVGLSSLRIVNGAAAKLPPPQPAWHRELMSLDLQRGIQRALAYEAWRAREFARRDRDDSRNPFVRAVEPVRRVINVARAERNVAVYRTLERSLVPADACAAPPLPPDVPNLESLRRRVARFRIEREGVANFFAVRSGVPLSRASSCRAAQWNVTADGVAFPRPMPVEPQQTVIVPLAWRIR